MRNPDFTKEEILKQSGILFNTQGYKATSIRHITDATCYTKGAIYRHFKNKEELEKESLFHLSNLMFEKIRVVIKEQETAGNKLRALFRFFESYITNPPLPGGCPLLNAAIEADDAHPALRNEALKILDMLKGSLIRILRNGIKHGQIKTGIDEEFYACLIIALLEGAIMMSKLRGNSEDIKRINKHLEKQISEIER